MSILGEGVGVKLSEGLPLSTLFAGLHLFCVPQLGADVNVEKVNTA